MISSTTTSSIAKMGVVSLIALNTFIPYTLENIHKDQIPRYGKLHYKEETNTPKISSYEKNDYISWPEEALEQFPGISGFTEEEAKVYQNAIDELFIPTGRNLFTL
jgi:hypothetical protein